MDNSPNKTSSIEERSLLLINQLKELGLDNMIDMDIGLFESDIFEVLSGWRILTGSSFHAKQYQVSFGPKHKFLVEPESNDPEYNVYVDEQIDSSYLWHNGPMSRFSDYACTCLSYLSNNHRQHGRYCKHIKSIIDSQIGKGDFFFGKKPEEVEVEL